MNPNNPITNTRSLGDNPENISVLGCEYIRGMQDNGLIATAKHFPGDGLDDRDQHICTTFNPLSQSNWFEISGKPFKSAIELGVWSIMIGHIALPSFETKNSDRNLIPAIASKAIITDLLIEKLNFQNLIISDALEMGGITGIMSVEESLIQILNAGCDMLLFSNVERDFSIIKNALENGSISKERIEYAARKVIALKEQIGLFASTKNIIISNSDKAEFQQLSSNIAKNAISIIKQNREIFPFRSNQNKILCFHIRGNPEYNVDTFDDLLRDKGYDVMSINELNEFPFHILHQFDIILVLATFGPTWGTSCIRPNGLYVRNLWLMMNDFKEKMMCISFGTPYLLHDFPWFETYINAYSPDIFTQKAVIEVLLGKNETFGISPVNLDNSQKIIQTLDKLE